MADVPVPLFGCVRDGQKSFPDCIVNVTRTYVQLQNYLTIVETIHHDLGDSKTFLDDVRLAFMYPSEYVVDTRGGPKPVVMGAMELPLSRLLALIDRVSMNPNSHVYGHLPDFVIYPALDSLRRFRDDAIVRAFHVKTAIRTFQRQFREARDNPAYPVCQRRLLREFQELQEELSY